jgi:hypothetical protein
VVSLINSSTTIGWMFRNHKAVGKQAPWVIQIRRLGSLLGEMQDLEKESRCTLQKIQKLIVWEDILEILLTVLFLTSVHHVFLISLLTLLYSCFNLARLLSGVIWNSVCLRCSNSKSPKMRAWNEKLKNNRVAKFVLWLILSAVFVVPVSMIAFLNTAGVGYFKGQANIQISAYGSTMELMHFSNFTVELGRPDLFNYGCTLSNNSVGTDGINYVSGCVMGRQLVNLESVLGQGCGTADISQGFTDFLVACAAKNVFPCVWDLSIPPTNVSIANPLILSFDRCRAQKNIFWIQYNHSLVVDDTLICKSTLDF